MSEYNLIQHPELIRRLTTLLGLRQPHITPTLDENVGAVIVLADLQREPEFLPRRFSANGGTDGDSATLGGGFRLENPAGSGIVAKVCRITVTTQTPTRTGGEQLWLEVIATSASSFNLSNVINQVRGRDWRKGISTLAGTVDADRPSSLFLLTGTAPTGGGALNQYSTALTLSGRSVASPGEVAQTALVDLDTSEWSMFLQPGFTLLGIMADPVPTGTASLQWEERRQI